MHIVLANRSRLSMALLVLTLPFLQLQVGNLCPREVLQHIGIDAAIRN